MYILSIETSCDETAAAVVDQGRLYSNIVYSQLSLHKPFGGVVPEIASRSHLKTIIPTIDEAIKQAKITKNQLDGVVVTYGPGLIGALLVGVNVAKSISFALKIPLVGINHLEGHIFANHLDHPELKPPLITLLISGGHTILILVENWGKYRILGRTVDDAAGEAFDKVAKMLTLGYPGGPVIDKYSKHGNPDFHHFPRALLKEGNFNFSFSGLKTAVLNYIESKSEEYVRDHLADICASFQKSVTDVLIEKTMMASRQYNIKQVAVVGGVARNGFLRQQLLEWSQQEGVRIFLPSPDFCTDNAAMIGMAGVFHLDNGRTSSYALDAVANLKLNAVED